MHENPLIREGPLAKAHTDLARVGENIDASYFSVRSHSRQSESERPECLGLHRTHLYPNDALSLVAHVISNPAVWMASWRYRGGACRL
jgi:hypothetical protein